MARRVREHLLLGLGGQFELARPWPLATTPYVV